MRIRPPLLLGIGVGIVFVGAGRTLEAIGAQNAVWACLVAAIVATVLMGVLSRSAVLTRLDCACYRSQRTNLPPNSSLSIGYSKLDSFTSETLWKFLRSLLAAGPS